MTAWLAEFGLTPLDWGLILLGAILVGFAKTGLSGVGTLAVLLLASVFEARPSTGILLPMLCLGDLFALRYYHRHAEWSHVLRLLPWALVGVGIGLGVGNLVDEKQFRLIMALTILAGLAIMIWRSRQDAAAAIPTHWAFAGAMGLVAGFTTMIGNAAGPVMAVYLLSMRLPKYAFIGTGAWYFFIVNLLKVPLHIWVWGTITGRTFLLDLLLLPAIAVGAVLGVRLIRVLPERPFRATILALTALAALRMLF